MGNNRVLDVYESGRVIRYHANYKFHLVQQSNADHQWGCVALIFLLHPNPSIRLVKRAAFHDAGELRAGDLPHDFKVAHPEFAKQHASIEHQMAQKMGAPSFDEDQDLEDDLWISLVDQLEPVLLARLYVPDVLTTPKWREKMDKLYNRATILGVAEHLKEILND